MRLPPDTILLAAKRWLEILPTSGGVARARALLTTHVAYSDLTPTQYATALTWLRDLELLQDVGSLVPAARRILAAIFEKSAPPWVRDADQLVLSPTDLPVDIVSAGATLGIDENAVYEQLVASWGKVDTMARERVGAAGEAALVSVLRGARDVQVDHVSNWSDGFGYDIAFTQGEVRAHLEVKSTTRYGRFTAYLSRHEYRVMLRDSRWALVTVRLSAALDIIGVGSVSADWIATNAPRDSGTAGSWASCKLEIPDSAITSGVPRLGEIVSSRLPPW